MMRSTSIAGEGRDHQFRHRRKKKVSLLLPPISIQSSLNSSTNYVSTAGRFRYIAIIFFVVGSVVFLSKNANNQQQVPSDANMEKLTGSSRPFQYIGDFNPSEPLPWPEEEEDWHALHETLAKRVKESDELSINQGDDYLPQLVFYGDSITEGWNGTSFGNLPGPHRMWIDGEDETIRDVFANAFGDKSEWGERALKPPLILGISGSRTYDFIWRVNNGEFPVSPLLKNVEETDTTDGDAEFHREKLERIYILLMGTNNLGGGMLPGPTLEGMDSVGRTILQLHQKHFPNTPAAMLFSELLPRNDDFRAAKMCPARCKNVETSEPYKSFMPAINKVNRELPGLLDGWRKDFKNSRILLLSAGEVNASDQSNNVSYNTVIKCGGEMFAFKDIKKLDTYMPDRLHPNAKGYDLWSRCLKKGLDAVMSR